MDRTVFTPKIWLLLLLVLVAVGCKRGCTTHAVVDDESETRTIAGQKVEVTAKLIESNTHYLRRQNSYSYHMRFDVKLAGRPTMKEVALLPAEYEDEPEDALPRFEVAFSPDKKHFAIALDKKVVDVFHLLEKGVPFAAYFEPSTVYIDDFNWDHVDTPEEIARLLIRSDNMSMALKGLDDYDFMNGGAGDNDHYFELAIAAQDPGSALDFVLLEEWPNSYLAGSCLAKERVAANSKASAEWKSNMQQKLLSLLRKKEVNNDITDMVFYFNDQLVYDSADVAFMQLWPGDWQAEDYFEQRVNATQSNGKAIAAKLQQRANTLITTVPVDSEYGQMEGAFKYLLERGDSSNFKASIELLLGDEVFHDLSYSDQDLYMDQYENLGPVLQQLVLERYTELCRQDFDYSVFDFLGKHLTCEKLKVITADLPDYQKDNLPDRCKEEAVQ